MRPREPIYLDSSALAKVYMEEPESWALNEFLSKSGNLFLSELGVTEVVSAICRRARSGELPESAPGRSRELLLADVRSGFYRTVPLTPAVHREAERRLVSGTDAQRGLRGMDALHLALAVAAGAVTMAVYDRRLATAAVEAGLAVYPEPAA